MTPFGKREDAKDDPRHEAPEATPTPRPGPPGPPDPTPRPLPRPRPHGREERDDAERHGDIATPKRDEHAHEKAEAHPVPQAVLLRCPACGESFGGVGSTGTLPVHERKPGWECVGGVGVLLARKVMS